MPFPIYYQHDLAEVPHNNFILMQKANAGEAKAEHEVGQRYLAGNGFEADTLKSFYWIERAAMKKLPIALYNLAVFQNNGWGTEWNPYKAFDNFFASAMEGFPLGNYAVGKFFTDNLVVPKNLSVAYYFMLKAANSDVEQSKELLEKLNKSNPVKLDSSQVALIIANNKKNNFTPKKDADILSFYYFAKDSLTKTDDSTLLADVLNQNIKSNDEKSDIKTIRQDSFFVKNLLDKINWGSPEAMILLGRLYEEGIYFKKNILSAATYYCRATRLESSKAEKILRELIKTPDFLVQLKKEAEKGNVEAQYLVGSLYAQHLITNIVGTDALKLLQKSANKNYIPAVIELGDWTIGGIVVYKNIALSTQLWRHAMRHGNKEAEIRLGVSQLLADEIFGEREALYQTFEKGEEEGSILAQTALGICFEKGILVKKDLAKAVTYYRKAAFRGSQNAFSALKRIYDNLRPNDPRFIVTE